VIAGVHAIVFSRDPEADRAFCRDVLGWSWVDAHDGWLIFALPPAELAFHPTDETPRHELYLMCHDVAAVVEELGRHGVEPVGPIEPTSFGLLTSIRLPSGTELGIYQPRHASPLFPTL
jgi:predicted enzyme related to lactoylglutathione lyase